MNRLVFICKNFYLKNNCCINFRILVTAVTADTIPSDLHLFRNYVSPQDLMSLPEAGSVSTKKAEEQLVWQAARASGAAPTYFRYFLKL